MKIWILSKFEEGNFDPFDGGFTFHSAYATLELANAYADKLFPNGEIDEEYIIEETEVIKELD